MRCLRQTVQVDRGHAPDVLTVAFHEEMVVRPIEIAGLVMAGRPMENDTGALGIWDKGCRDRRIAHVDRCCRDRGWQRGRRSRHQAAELRQLVKYLSEGVVSLFALIATGAVFR